MSLARRALPAAAAVLGLAGLAWWLRPEEGSAGEKEARHAEAARPASPVGAGAATPADGRTPLQATEARHERDRAAPAREVVRRGTASADGVPPVAPAGRTVRGRVVAEGTHLPVAGVSVSIEAGPFRESTRSDDEGRFALEWPGGLLASLRLAHPRFVDLASPLRELAEDAEYRMVPSGSIVGRVESSVTLDAASVRAWHQRTSSDRFWTSAETALAADGTFAFHDLVPGDYALNVLVAERSVALETGIPVEPGETREVVLRASASASIAGRALVQPSRAPAADVALRLVPVTQGLPRVVREESIAQAKTDAGGAFAFEGLAPGPYRLEAYPPVGRDVRRRIDVAAADARVEVELELFEPGRIAGTVVESDGAAASRVSVFAFPERMSVKRIAQLRRDALPGGVVEATTDGGGRFLLDGVSTGEALLVVALRDELASPGIARVPNVAPGALRDGVAITLPASRRVTGVVRDPGGAPLAGAKIGVAPSYALDAPAGTRALTDAGGRFSIADFPDTASRIHVHLRGWLPAWSDVAAGSKDPPELGFSLEPAHALAGRLVDAPGFGLPGHPVTLQPAPQPGEPFERGGPGWRATATDGLGRFELTGLAAGEWMLSASSYGWRMTGSDPRPVSIPADADVELVLEPRTTRPERGAITGVVALRGGGLPSGLRVEGLLGGSVTVREGEFRATGLTPTRQQARIVADGHLPYRTEAIFLRPGETHDLGRIELQPRE